MFIKLSKTANPKVQLICFPYAGSGASLFYPWVNFLSKDFEVWAFQPPGHEELMDQRLISDLAEMKQYILQKIIPIINRPFILFGHSLGSVLAYETTKELQKRNMVPISLTVSGRQPPHLKSKMHLIAHLNNEDFIKEVFELNGTPPELMASKDFLEMATPILRADFKLAENYQIKIEEKIKCPVSVLGSTTDKWIDTKEIAEWSKTTEKPCETRIFEGDHFYLKQNPRLVAEYLNNLLEKNQ